MFHRGCDAHTRHPTHSGMLGGGTSQLEVGVGGRQRLAGASRRCLGAGANKEGPGCCHLSQQRTRDGQKRPGGKLDGACFGWSEPQRKWQLLDQSPKHAQLGRSGPASRPPSPPSFNLSHFLLYLYLGNKLGWKFSHHPGFLISLPNLRVS